MPLASKSSFRHPPMYVDLPRAMQLRRLILLLKASAPLTAVLPRHDTTHDTQ
jgi:hypothetical protein